MSQNLPLIIFCFFLLISTLFAPSTCLSKLIIPDQSKIRGMFVFGSSLVDNGNNNFLPNSLARADYVPYGIDFPSGQSGRFTNGKNVIDLLGEKLRLPSYIPPFNDPTTKGSRVVNGVNYASGGSGILDDTGAVAGNVTSLNQQIRNFKNVTLPELKLQLGKSSSSSSSTDILSQFLFVVGSGGNDYSFNYFLGLSNSNVTLEAFTANLTTTLSLQLKMMYNLGARKFVLMAINPNGCSPTALARVPSGNGCVQSLNRAAHMFNVQLKNLVDGIRPQMPGSNLVLVNAYKVIRDIVKFPIAKGFRNTTNACCDVAGGTGILCNRGGLVCTNRNEYVYFDGLHPTEAINVVIANKAFSSNFRAEVYPYNVKQLSEI